MLLPYFEKVQSTKVQYKLLWVVDIEIDMVKCASPKPPPLLPNPELRKAKYIQLLVRRPFSTAVWQHSCAYAIGTL